MKFSIKEFATRIIVTMLLVFITAKLTPFFRVASGLGSLFWASLTIAFVQYFLVNIFGLGQSRLAHGGSGFLTTAIVLYLAGVFSKSISISLVGALIGAFIIGIVDALIPGQKLIK